MQKNMIRQGKLPTAAQVKDYKEELDFKKNLLDNAENTQARL
jgi:hypothetical protein